jgi:hypothetical protein
MLILFALALFKLCLGGDGQQPVHPFPPAASSQFQDWCCRRQEPADVSQRPAASNQCRHSGQQPEMPPPQWEKPEGRHGNPPSLVTIKPRGAPPFAVILCKYDETWQAHFHDKLKSKHGLTAKAACLVNKKEYANMYAGQPGVPNMTVIPCPAYCTGSERDMGLDLLLNTGCQLHASECILLCCNNSFHRAPAVLAALMTRCGHCDTANSALATIANCRTIYAGHFWPPLEEWPRKESTGRHYRQFVELSNWATRPTHPRHVGAAGPPAAAKARPPESPKPHVGAAGPPAAAKAPPPESPKPPSARAPVPGALTKEQRLTKFERETTQKTCDVGTASSRPTSHPRYSGSTCLEPTGSASSQPASGSTSNQAAVEVKQQDKLAVEVQQEGKFQPTTKKAMAMPVGLPPKGTILQRAASFDVQSSTPEAELNQRQDKPKKEPDDDDAEVDRHHAAGSVTPVGEVSPDWEGHGGASPTLSHSPGRSPSPDSSDGEVWSDPHEQKRFTALPYEGKCKEMEGSISGLNYL